MYFLLKNGRFPAMFSGLWRSTNPKDYNTTPWSTSRGRTTTSTLVFSTPDSVEPCYSEAAHAMSLPGKMVEIKWNRIVNKNISNMFLSVEIPQFWGIILCEIEYHICLEHMQNVYSKFRFETKIDFQGLLTIEINGSTAGFLKGVYSLSF